MAYLKRLLLMVMPAQHDKGSILGVPLLSMSVLYYSPENSQHSRYSVVGASALNNMDIKVKSSHV